MQEISLYYHPLSNCSQRVVLLLEEKGIPYKKHVVNLIKSEQLKQEFLQINPKGRVPAIAYQGEYLAESCDIMRFLETKFSDTCFTPTDPENLKIMNSFLESAKASHDCVKDFVYSSNIGRLPTDDELALYDRIDPENSSFHHRRRKGEVGCDLTKATERVRNDFWKIELALEGKKWIATEYSLADMAWFPNTILFRQCGFDFSDMPNVMVWIKRMESRTSYRDGLKQEIDKIPAWFFRSFMKYKRFFQPNRR